MGEIVAAALALLAAIGMSIAPAIARQEPMSVAAEEEMRIAPQPGPQTTFAESAADIAIFGGAAGGGKSYALLYEAVKWTIDDRIRSYRAVIFRRTQPSLVGGGGLWDESQTIYRACGGRPRGAPTLDWTFEAASGRVQDRHRIEFRHLQRDTTVHDHQGRQYAFIGFDELQQFTSKQFWYMVSRLRSVSGVRPMVRATCNPDPDSFVATLIAWWIGADGYPIPERSGVIRWLVRVDDRIEWYDTEEEARAAHPHYLVAVDGRMERFPSEAAARAAHPDGEVLPEHVPLSLTFIGSKLADNPALIRNDPTYRGKLLAMGRVDRMRLLGDESKGGNWFVRDSAGLVFRARDFILSDGPPAPIVRTVRAWDRAASPPTPKHPDPDWSRGVRVSLCEGGMIWIDDLASGQMRPTEMLRMLRSKARRDGVRTTVALWQDTGGAGVVDVDTCRAALAGYVVEVVESWSADTSDIGSDEHRSSRAKRAFARVWAPLVERGQVYIKRSAWAGVVTAECDSFPDARHDDIVDAISLAIQVLLGGEGMGFLNQVRGAAEQLRQGVYR